MTLLRNRALRKCGYFFSLILFVFVLVGCGNEQSDEDTAQSISSSIIDGAAHELQGQFAAPNEESAETAEAIASSLDEVLNNKEYYPDINKITVCDDASIFNVHFSSADINVYETALRMSLYFVGMEYQSQAGIEPYVEVNYIDDSTGKAFSRGNSSEIENNVEN